MNWEAIGAFGEIIGAIAVLVTLACLATQIRRNTRQLASTSLQGLADRAENRVLVIASNAEFAGVFAKLQTGPESLSGVDVIQLTGWIAACGMKAKSSANRVVRTGSISNRPCDSNAPMLFVFALLWEMARAAHEVAA